MAKRQRPATATRVEMEPVAAARGWRPDLLAPVEPSGDKGEKIKIINWGGNNMLPQDVLRIVYDSGTAEACIERLAQFIGGEGFTSKVTATTMANEHQTLNQLLEEASWDLAFGFGVAVIVRYTFGGEVGEVFLEEASCLRREKDGLGRYVINYGLAEGKMTTSDNRVYLPFNARASQDEISEEVIAAFNSEAGYWGHLLYAFTAKSGRTNYAVPSFYSGKEDLENDAAISKYDLKNAVDGFFPDAIMTVVGKKYSGEPDPNFKPAENETLDDAPWVESEDLAAVKKILKGMKGSANGASIGLLTADSEDELPKLEFFNNGPNSKNLTDMVNRIVGKVCRHIGVPPVLIGVDQAGLLGNNQQIVNSIKLFGLVVKPRRKLFTEALAQIYPGLDLTVTQLDPVDYIDPAIIAKMTDNEIRALRGLPPLDEEFTDEQQATIRALRALPDELRAAVLQTLTAEELRAFLPALAKPSPAPVPAA
ncbi:hypothetical protein [Hymenobacter sp. GOD-10R]|uniref:hypothetical protein n=1 Tax=Hymenobacter sp. GOD-10R TaxID=3093922 RepID=UPI002D77DAF5|nr:hypothetical protein [Hymenobacter sp. GOD-10R]WRQ26672.1 hypothetical protein SD425_16490 [Hymenobacter sp. GOD-10R]